MARQGITGEQIFTAADELRDEGIAPTVQTVRERIGSGSFSTINTHLGEWKAHNTGAAVADIPAIPDKVQAVFAQIWLFAHPTPRKGQDCALRAVYHFDISTVSKIANRLGLSASMHVGCAVSN
jgi:hypothetical protein